MDTFREALEKAAHSADGLGLAAPDPATASAQGSYRFLIVNENYLGHATVHRLFCQALQSDPTVDFERERDAVTLDTVDNLLEKVQRCFASLRFGNAWMRRQNLDFGRWRFQRFVALLARKRVEEKLRWAEQAGRPYDALAFHSQTAAFACTDIMRGTPSLVSTDITNRQASHEWNSPATRWTYGPSCLWERKVFQAAAAIAGFSQWTCQAIVEENPQLSAAKVLHYPPGVTLAPFLALSMERPSIAGRKLKLLFVGGDFQRKGGDDLRAVFECLGDHYELHIVSNALPPGREGPGVTVYRNLTPYSTELLALYGEADIFVLPTRNEAYGHVFIEAMAAGLPVVATDINAIPEILPEAGRDFLIRPGDREGLFRALQVLGKDPALRTALGHAGRQRAVELFDADRCFGRYVACLKEISAKKKS